ncbi:probable serine/threonine-protein kinase PBL11 isoform X1 [Malania oleifera]|uniref:probable serine/threonine-protein kinase PBL11 isoform X1 n=1 Tax=Malania oleifera TaxID=397392 RepID=UPI0025ADE4FA|nr:probable serine/threonine-protein kinase PBL11 isoform X1 [Malania oleifera]
MIVPNFLHINIQSFSFAEVWSSKRERQGRRGREGEREREMGNCLRARRIDNHWSCSSSNIRVPAPAAETEHRERDEVAGENGIKGEEAPESFGGGAGKMAIPAMKVFTLAELKSATKNFRPDTMLGEGGFGQVFKGWVDRRTLAPSKVGVGMPVAVKKASPDSSQGLHEWQSEVKFLGMLSHPNLVRLLGFCWEEKEFLLVYEYMQRGSLENHLFRSAEPLPWSTRLKIAIGAARGLSFLHTSGMKIIYRDFKPSNILLDEFYNAKLSDFGLAKLGPSDGNTHVSTRPMGTYGYAAPEYVSTGHLYIRSDVYGFGVVLLEMLTGLRAIDTNRPNGHQNLVEWARPFLPEKRKLKRIMDPGLEDLYPLKGATQMAELVLHCLESDPKNRPSMVEVLERLERINSITKKQKEPKPKPKPTSRPTTPQRLYSCPNTSRPPVHHAHRSKSNFN